MLKLVVAVFAIALAGTAGAAGWRDLKIDGSSEAAFRRSLEAFNEELSPERHQVFTAALMDIWVQGTEVAKANQREYTVNEYSARWLELRRSRDVHRSHWRDGQASIRAGQAHENRQPSAAGGVGRATIRAAPNANQPAGDDSSGVAASQGPRDSLVRPCRALSRRFGGARSATSSSASSRRPS